MVPLLAIRIFWPHYRHCHQYRLYKTKDQLKFTTANSFSRVIMYSLWLKVVRQPGSDAVCPFGLTSDAGLLRTGQTARHYGINYMDQDMLWLKMPMVGLLFPFPLWRLNINPCYHAWRAQTKGMVLYSVPPLIWIYSDQRVGHHFTFGIPLYFTAIPTAMLCLTLLTLTFIRTLCIR